MTVSEFIKKIDNGEAKVLTLAAARQLIGKTIEWMYFGYHLNPLHVGKTTISQILSEYEIAQKEKMERFANRAEYWESYMSAEKLQEKKETLEIVDERGRNTCIVCHPESVSLYKELTFTCSDADREVYFIVVD